MKLLEAKEGIKAFYLYNGEEVCIYEDKVVIKDKTLPAKEKGYVACKNGVLFKCITDENNNLKYTFSRFDGNSFVLENFRYENKDYLSPEHFCSTEDSVDGVVKVAFMDNGTEHLFEFESKINQVIYVSATPGDYEKERSYEIVEQIIRPTGLLDPLLEVRPTKNQIDYIISDIKEQIKKGERTLITTLTIKMSEDLTAYLKEAGIKVAYLHSEIKALDRLEIIRKLRKGTFDVLVGINLLREGLDIPEVSLICILDADKEGFLRSARSLIQTTGRAARNANGKVIFYADNMTDSMKKCIDETARRRKIQEEYNQLHGIVPKTIIKEIGEEVRVIDDVSANVYNEITVDDFRKLTKVEQKKIIENLEKAMKEAAKNLDFEEAMSLRDIIFELKSR